LAQIGNSPIFAKNISDMTTTAANPQNNQDINAMLEGMANWEMPLLESFARNVNEIIARRKAPNLSKAETGLLQKINQGMPTAALDEYNSLKTKQKTGGLTEIEQARLNEVIDFIEAKEAEFLGYLISLAQLRKQPLEKLRKQLGIKPPVPHAW
jgi:uncharacterized protein YnzC (UPF0291/DUF896 family)